MGILNDGQKLSCLYPRERTLREQQEINKKAMERKERERQKIEQERRKEKEEEEALEQVTLIITMLL